MRDTARFCMDFLSETEHGLAPSPATSPENCFLVNGEPVSVALFEAHRDYTENVLGTDMGRVVLSPDKPFKGSIRR